MTAPRTGMTERQEQTLQAIMVLIGRNGRSPSFREIAAALGVGPSNINRLVAALSERGFIRYLPGKWRTIELVERAPVPWHQLPFALHAALEDFCAARGEDPANVIADAVAFHLDAFSPHLTDAEAIAEVGIAPIDLSEPSPPSRGGGGVAKPVLKRRSA